MPNNNPRRTRRSTFTEQQDLILQQTVKSGGVNNLQAVFETLAETPAFSNKTAYQIYARYYYHTRRTYPMFQIVGANNQPLARCNQQN